MSQMYSAKRCIVVISGGKAGSDDRVEGFIIVSPQKKSRQKAGMK